MIRLFRDQKGINVRDLSELFYNLLTYKLQTQKREGEEKRPFFLPTQFIQAKLASETTNIK